MTLNKEQRQGSKPRRKVGSRTVAKHGGIFAGHLLGGMVSKIVVALILALIATYVGVSKFTHLFAPHTTISTTVVLGKLIKIEQVHVASRSYPVDVTITQSVGVIPCFLICNHMELKGSGTDDAIVDLTTLTKQDVSIDHGNASVTIRMAAPAIGPAIVNPAACTISSSHGILNSATQDFRNNPNGYRPLYVAAQNKIHNAALHDQGAAPANSSPGSSALSASRRCLSTSASSANRACGWLRPLKLPLGRSAGSPRCNSPILRRGERRAGGDLASLASRRGGPRGRWSPRGRTTPHR